MSRIVVAGGDVRAQKLASLLSKDGYTVETIGLQPMDENDVHIEGADAVLFPYPFSVKNGRIPTMTDAVLCAEDVLCKVKKEACILSGEGLSGYIPQEYQRWMRYTDAEGFLEKNAELSAEAAVCEAMLYTRYALRGRNVLVTGYGLFGRALALKLRALNVKVWVAARKKAQLDLAVSDGMNAVFLQEMFDILPRMDMILNTIPANILDERLLKRIDQNSCILELASAPYGFDRELARTLGISCALLPGLPARYAPDSAAQILRDAAKELLERCGI